MRRTTVFADPETLGALRRIARAEGKSFAEVVRLALERYIAGKRAPARQPSLLGIGRSGRKDVAERHEDLLWSVPKRKW